jgi:hypothetical protein
MLERQLPPNRAIDLSAAAKAAYAAKQPEADANALSTPVPFPGYDD